MTNVTLTLTTVELDDIINALEEYAGGPSDMTEALKDKVAAAERQAMGDGVDADERFLFGGDPSKHV